MPASSPHRFREERRLLARGMHRIAGVDEAGRGPLAGPVVAAAVVFPSETIEAGLPREWRDLNDSKQLTARRRDAFFDWIPTAAAAAAVAIVDARTIDAINILEATRVAIRRCIADLPGNVEHLLVDGLPVPDLPAPQTALVKGDSLSYSIAAASVLAKVTRDRILVELDREHPGYGFARHKGYPTPEHLDALHRLGPCPAHRRSFAPVRRDPQLDLFS